MSRNAILAVSFGTSYAETREKTIGAVEQTLRKTFPGWDVYRAFTSPTILRKMAADGVPADNLWQALEHLMEQGASRILCQPTYVINGEEHKAMMREVMRSARQFDQIVFGTPLLTAQEDYEAVAKAIEEEFSSLTEEDALVLMGHGTTHYANTAYAALEYVFQDHGVPNIFVGTVEAYPGLPQVLRRMERFKPKRVVLAPLMVAAGDHAQNDMAGEADSWKTAFKAEGYKVQTVLKGLGEYPAIRALYAAHAQCAAARLE